jgi:hypothetical protein
MKYISLYVAGMLIVMHNLLPHEHDIAYVQHNLAISEPAEFDFSTFIKNVFLQDLGEDHLENFHLSDSNQIANLDFEFVIFPLVVCSTLCNFQSKKSILRLDVYSDFEDPLDNRLNLPSVGLRAPPYIS